MVSCSSWLVHDWEEMRRVSLLCMIIMGGAVRVRNREAKRKYKGRSAHS